MYEFRKIEIVNIKELKKQLSLMMSHRDFYHLYVFPSFLLGIKSKVTNPCPSIKIQSLN